MAPTLDTPNEVLTKRQLRFVDAIAQDDDRSGTKCAIDSGYAESSAAEMASVNLRNPRIVRAITDRKAQLAAMAGVDVALVVRELLYVAIADPRELIHTRIGCCRHCWGIDHKREWMEHEYATALNDALQSMGLPPDFEGGLGYTPTREPSSDCPKCKGEGIPRTWLADSRNLSPAAARLMASVKQTKDGIEIKMRDQNAALMALGRYLGMFTDKTELSGPGGGPIPMGAMTLDDLTDEQLMAIAAGGLAKMKAASHSAIPAEIDALLELKPNLALSAG